MTTDELRPHPLNGDFTWTDRTGVPGSLSADEVAAFDHDGFFVLRGALTPEQVADVTAAIDPFEVAGEEELRRHGGTFLIARADEITFTTHLVARSATLRRFVAAEPFQGIVRDLIGPDVRLYWDQAVYKKPDTEALFPWHQDNGYAFIDPQQYVTCWVPLVDATVDNGCPWALPTVHRLGTLDHRVTPLGLACVDAPPGAVPVPARAGDIVVFSSLTPHSTGPNRTADVRKAYIVQYAPDGAAVLGFAPDGAPAAVPTRTPADDPARQFPVLRGGRPVDVEG